MNAYALGGPEGAAIILTEGLIRRMTRDEVAGILAHEVAHIRNNDAWTMSWAAALHRSIEWTSSTGLALLRAQHSGAQDSRPLAALLRAAPSIAQLLRLALSRTRELDADATAPALTSWNVTMRPCRRLHVRMVQCISFAAIPRLRNESTLCSALPTDIQVELRKCIRRLRGETTAI